MVTRRISAKFPDVSDLGRAAGFELGFRQLDPGPAPVSADLILGEQVTLVRMGFDRAYHQLGTPPAGTKTFGIPVRGLLSWCGRGYEQSSILPFNLPDGIDGVSESGFEACTLSVSDDALRRVSEAFRVPISDVLIAARANTVLGNGPATQLLRRLISDVVEDETRRLHREREEELVVALLQAALPGSAVVDRSSPTSRSRAVAKAVALVDRLDDEAITVGDICRHTGIALRTLNRAFREHFGVGPKAYLIRRRLSSVRAELVRGPGNTVIADVANRHGFWHMGQFAKDYRTVFGELPSETLKRNRDKQR